MKAIVWSKPACGYCVKAKNLLKTKNLLIEYSHLVKLKTQKKLIRKFCFFQKDSLLRKLS